MIPLKYNFRNLRVRWKTTLMTVLGTGLVVWSSCILFGLVEGLEHSLNVSGDPLDLIVLRKGSSNETTGGFASDKADDLINLPGFAATSTGRPLAAKELLNIPLAERVEGTRTNIIVRGVQPASRKLRPDFKIVAGRDFDEGKGECIVSRKLSRAVQGRAGRRHARVRRQGDISRRRSLHRRRQRRRERGLGRPQGPREEHRPRRFRLLRPAPRGQRRTISTNSKKPSTPIPGSSWSAMPESTLFRDPDAIEHSS